MIREQTDGNEDSEATQTAADTSSSLNPAGDSVSRNVGHETSRGKEKTAQQPYELDLNRFPDKMMWLLDNKTAPEALWWLPEGDALAIDKPKFMEELLEQQFRGNKFSSITRKLNRW